MVKHIQFISYQANVQFMTFGVKWVSDQWALSLASILTEQPNSLFFVKYLFLKM